MAHKTAKPFILFLFFSFFVILICSSFYGEILTEVTSRFVPSPLIWSRTEHNETLELLEMLPKLPAPPVSCYKIVQKDKKTIEIAQKVSRTRNILEDLDFVDEARDCQTFIRSRGYLTKPVNKEEEDFPLAFSILMFKEVMQVERLLRAIYRPQNIYCINVDSNSPASVYMGMEAIVECFDNVFILDRPVDVAWGKFSLELADIMCMEATFKRSKRWKYYINLAGQEFPLKTNLEIVRILTALNGSNAIQAVQNHSLEGRWQSHLPAPYNFTVTKGQWHMAATRHFVEYVLFDKRALALRDWVSHTSTPDETFAATLNHSPHLGVPGAYLGKPWSGKDGYEYIARYIVWTGVPSMTCFGQWVRTCCVFGLADLAVLSQRYELFVNKFYQDFQPMALDCMEELHYNRTRDDILGRDRLNLTFYSHLPQVKKHVPSKQYSTC